MIDDRTSITAKPFSASLGETWWRSAVCTRPRCKGCADAVLKSMHDAGTPGTAFAAWNAWARTPSLATNLQLNSEHMTWRSRGTTSTYSLTPPKSASLNINQPITGLLSLACRPALALFSTKSMPQLAICRGNRVTQIRRESNECGR